MFTGLIATIGTVRDLSTRGNYREFRIAPDEPFAGVAAGESIAVAGPCLTVKRFDADSFCVEASQETIRLTTLGILRTGGRVNLERALRADDRLGGHLVSGHIDCTSAVKNIEKVGESLQLEIELAEEFKNLIVDKGSVAIDGVSLTVMAVSDKSFRVNLIPETQQRTTLAGLAVGGRVNLEFDLIGKYILRFLDGKSGKSQLSLKAMRQMGY